MLGMDWKVLLPDAILLLVVQNPACAVVILIYDQVSICVVARVKVGDHTGGDPKAPHHCTEKAEKSPQGLWAWNTADSWPEGTSAGHQAGIA